MATGRFTSSPGEKSLGPMMAAVRFGPPERYRSPAETGPAMHNSVIKINRILNTLVKPIVALLNRDCLIHPSYEIDRYKLFAVIETTRIGGRVIPASGGSFESKTPSVGHFFSELSFS